MTQLMMDRRGLEVALELGYCWAQVEGRDHLTKVVAVHGDSYALLKEVNGRPTLVPLSRIQDLHMDEVAS